MKLDDVTEESLDGQKRLTNSLAVIARDLQVSIFLVAHTRKLKDESEIPDATNIMGSSHIRNLCDNIICVWRNRYKEKLRLANLGKVGNRLGSKVSEDTKLKLRLANLNSSYIAK